MNQKSNLIKGNIVNFYSILFVVLTGGLFYYMGASFLSWKPLLLGILFEILPVYLLICSSRFFEVSDSAFIIHNRVFPFCTRRYNLSEITNVEVRSGYLGGVVYIFLNNNNVKSFELGHIEEMELRKFKVFEQSGIKFKSFLKEPV